METVVCDLCQSTDTRRIYRLRDTNYGTPGVFDLVQCRVCHLAYLNPRPTAASLAQHYPVDRYDPFAALKPGNTITPTATQIQRARALTQLCPPGTVLDVGTGSGHFLVAMRQAGWAGAGVEPNASMADFAQRALQLNVVAGDIFAWPFSEPVNLMTLWDALEHTPSPMAVLRQARALLKPGGWLALSVPNWDSLERRLFRERWIAHDAPRHLYHFGPRALRAMLGQAGFAVRRLQATAPVQSLASNALRLGGDLLFRGGQAKSFANTAAGDASPAPVSGARRRLIQAAYVLLTLPNAAANVLQRGANLTVLAQPT